jgi:hypothetical protein
VKTSLRRISIPERIDLTLELRGRSLLVQYDHVISDGELDEDGEPLPDDLQFNYRVFDLEEEAEITQLNAEDRQMIHQAIMTDLQTICAGGSHGS